MTGNHTNWKAYNNSGFIDLVVLDGLYHISMKNKTLAQANFLTCLTLSSANYDA